MLNFWLRSLFYLLYEWRFSGSLAHLYLEDFIWTFVFQKQMRFHVLYDSRAVFWLWKKNFHKNLRWFYDFQRGSSSFYYTLSDYLRDLSCTVQPCYSPILLYWTTAVPRKSVAITRYLLYRGSCFFLRNKYNIAMNPRYWD